MARAKMRLRRLDKGKIYRAANASTVRRLLPQQQSPRCLSVLIILDESCSISRDLLETSRENIREAIEVLNKMLDEHLREFLELRMNELCDGLLTEAGKGNAGRFRRIRYRKLSAFADRRLWYKRQINLRKRFLEKRFAEWYREGPPNDKKICHTMRTAA